MKERLLIIALVVLAGAASYTFSDWFESENKSALTLYGNVDIREVQLGFRVAGRLQEMHAEEGDAVEAGALLASLDDKPYRQALSVANAHVDEAAAALQLRNAGTRPQEIRQARQGVNEAEAAFENADRELTRQKELMASQLGTQQLLDTAKAEYDQAEARLAATKESLALALEGFRNEEIAAAQAGLAAAEAQREQINTQLEDTRLYSPSAGVIMTRSREPGSMLEVGAPVYTLSLTNKVYIRAYVNEPSLGLAVPGAKVTVHTDTNSKTYSGQVGFVSPRAEFTPKSVETVELRSDLVYRLRIVVSDADENLRQGMPVTVRFAED